MNSPSYSRFYLKHKLKCINTAINIASICGIVDSASNLVKG